MIYYQVTKREKAVLATGGEGAKKKHCRLKNRQPSEKEVIRDMSK